MIIETYRKIQVENFIDLSVSGRSLTRYETSSAGSSRFRCIRYLIAIT